MIGMRRRGAAKLSIEYCSATEREKFAKRNRLSTVDKEFNGSAPLSISNEPLNNFK